LKTRNLLALLATTILILVMVATSCAAPTATAPEVTKTVNVTTTVTSTPQAVATDKKYNCVNPSGNFVPVQTKSLAARPDTLDGKKIYVVQGEADPVIMPALIERLKKDYPKTTWEFYQPSSSFGLSAPDDTMKKDAQGLIRGIGW